MKKTLLILLLLLGNRSFGQTTEGTDFWICPLKNLITSDSFFVIISSEKANSATVDIPGKSWSKTVTLGLNDLQRIYIPNTYKPTTYNTILDLGIHVTSNLPISVYVLSAQSATTDASCVFPTVTQPKGGTYYSLNPILYNTGYNSNNVVGVVCIDDSAKVTITPRTNTSGGQAANTPFNVKLKKGQIYISSAKNYMAGTLVVPEAGKRVAVFAGDECVAIRCAACDHIFEQIPPTTILGKSFILTPFLQQTKGYDFQMIATENGTTVNMNGNFLVSMNKGDTVYKTVWGDSLNCVLANKPILLVQYMTGIVCQTPKGGDPAMLVVNPNEQMISRAIVSTANTTLVKTHYINIVVSDKGRDSTYLDGSLLAPGDFKKVPCDKYYFYTSATTPGNHKIECRYGFISYLYGIGQAESYAYSAGCGLKNLKRFIISQSYPSCDSGFIVKLSSKGDSATKFKWEFNGQKDTAKNPFFSVKKPGIYTVKMLYLPLGSTQWDSTTSDVQIDKPEFTDFILFDSITVCDTMFKISLPQAPFIKYLWNTGQTTSELKVKTSGNYKVRVNNTITNCTTYDSAWVFLKDKVYPLIASTLTSGCPGGKIYFKDSSKLGNDSIKQLSWYSDYLFMSHQKADTIGRTYANDYIIKLVVETKNGCKDSIQKNILVASVPISIAGVTIYDTCFRSNKFRFNNGSYSTVGKITGYKWIFGDGDSSFSMQAYKHFKQPGKWSYQIIAFGETACFDSSDIKYVTVYPAPAAAISIIDSMICKPSNFFRARNPLPDDGKPKFHIWDWGDGTGMTLNPPADKNYADTGIFNISYSTGYTQTGCTDTVWRKVQVVENPVASLQLDMMEWCLNRNYYMFRSTSNAKGALNKSLTWNWGDGTTTQDSQVYSKKYSAPGTYQVKLYFSTGKGCQDSAKKNISVYQSPVSKFSVTDSNICGPNNFYTLLNQSTAPNNAKWLWDLGDGNTAPIKQPGSPISYQNGGNYTIMLAVQDPLINCSDTSYHKVHVLSGISMKPRATDTVICSSVDEIQFTDSTNYGNLKASRLWMFNGDPTDTSSQKTIKKKFSGTGFHNVILMGGEFGTCADTLGFRIQLLYPDSLLNISHALKYACINGLANFNSTVNTGTWTYDWKLGDGKTSTLANPSNISYALSGKKNIALTVKDAGKCNFSAADSLDIFPAPIVGINSLALDTQCLRYNSFAHAAIVNSATFPVEYHWDLDEGMISNLSSTGSYPYANSGTKNIKLILIDKNQCKDSAEKTVHLNLSPTQQYSGDTACLGATGSISTAVFPAPIKVLNLDWYLDGLYIGSGQNAPYIFAPVGTHSLYSILETVDGCKDTGAAVTILVNPLPRAGFSIDIKTPKSNGIPVSFMDSSSADVVSRTWLPDGKPLFTGLYGDYTYPSLGDKTARLIVTNNFGCVDTFDRSFNLVSSELFFMPSSFTPNQDGRNEIFRPAHLTAVLQYRMEIFNRWGEKLFETSDPQSGWDGMYQGKPVPQGVYVYKVFLVYFTGTKYSNEGNVTLLR